MMNTNINKTYNEKDIEIRKDGILVKNTFFGKKEIADAFNELVLMKNFIEDNVND